MQNIDWEKDVSKKPCGVKVFNVKLEILEWYTKKIIENLLPDFFISSAKINTVRLLVHPGRSTKLATLLI